MWPRRSVLQQRRTSTTCVWLSYDGPPRASIMKLPPLFTSPGRHCPASPRLDPGSTFGPRSKLLEVTEVERETERSVRSNGVRNHFTARGGSDFIGAQPPWLSASSGLFCLIRWYRNCRL